MSFTDTGLDVAQNAMVDAQIDASMPQGNIGVNPDVEPEDDTPIFDSVIAGFQTSGVMTGIFRMDNKDTADPVTDPSFSIEEYAKQNVEDAKLLNDLLQNEDLFNKIIDLRNETQMREWLAKVREAKALTATMWANPVAGVGGMLSGIALDLIPIVVGSGGLGALTGISKNARKVKEITAAIRGGGAFRAGVIGGIEGGAERVIHSFSDPMVTTDEIILSAVLGITLGGGLGALFPTAIGGQGVIRDMASDTAERHADMVIRAARASRGARDEQDSVGAARVPGTAEVQVPGRGAAGTGIVRAVTRLPGIRSLRMERWIRNPRRVLVDMGITGKKQFETEGLEGLRMFYDRMSRVLRVGTANQAEIDQHAARPITMEDMRNIYRDELTRVEQQSQKTYNEMIRQIYGKGALKGQLINSAVAELPVIRNLSKVVKQQEFEMIADEFAQAKALGVEDKVDIIPQHIRQQLDQDQLKQFEDFVKKQAAIDDEYYQKMGALEVHHKLIEPEELIPGYRPQRWNTDAIRQDAKRFDNFLRRVFQQEPDEEFLRASYAPRHPETGEILEWDGTLEGLRKIDEDLADDAIEMWDASLKNDAIETRGALAAKRRKELKKLRAKTREEIEERLAKATEKDRKLLERLEQQRLNTKSEAERTTIADRMGKVEKRIVDEEKKYAAIRQIDDNVKELDDFIGKTGSRAQRKGLKKAVKAARRANAAELRAEGARVISQSIKRIRDALLNNDGVGSSFVANEFTTSSARFLRRAIKLGAERFSDDARHFLNTQSGAARRSYDHSTAPQIAMRDVTGSTGDFASTTFDDYKAKLREWVLEGFEDDASLRGVNTPEHARAMDRASQFFDQVMQEFGGLPQPGTWVGRTGTQMTGIGTSLTATMLLGGVAIAQLSDLAVTALAGGRLGTGLRFMLKRVGKDLKQLEDIEMAVLLQGGNTMDATRFRAMFDLDEDIYMAGGKLAKVRRIVDEVGVVEGWANLMHIWNRRVRGAFGMDFARRMDADFKNFDSLSDDMKRFYAKHSIDAEDAKAISEMLDRSHHTLMDGNIRVPDSAVWADEADDLLTKYKVALRSAGDEALLDPSIADRPFMRSSALGRVILQFTSFMFKAADKFIPVLAQEAMLNPRQMNVIGSIFLTGTIAPLVGYIQAARYGRADEWLDNLNSSEGFRDNMWDALVRSPLMAGASSTQLELLMSHMGTQTNDLLESATGVRPFKEDQTRFRQMQGIMPLFGALPALGNTAVQSLGNVTRGEYDKVWDTANKRLPIMNVFYWQLLNQAMEK